MWWASACSSTTLRSPSRPFFSTASVASSPFSSAGKHLLEVFQDGDEHECGADNVRPQRHLSADAQVFFGPTMGADEEAHKLADFYAWFRASELPARGWSEGADELSLGRIPVADLRRDTDELFGLSDEQVWSRTFSLHSHRSNILRYLTLRWSRRSRASSRSSRCARCHTRPRTLVLERLSNMP